MKLPTPLANPPVAEPYVMLTLDVFVDKKARGDKKEAVTKISIGVFGDDLANNFSTTKQDASKKNLVAFAYDYLRGKPDFSGATDDL